MQSSNTDILLMELFVNGLLKLKSIDKVCVIICFLKILSSEIKGKRIQLGDLMELNFFFQVSN